MNNYITFVFIDDSKTEEIISLIDYYKSNGISNIKFFTSKDINIPEVVYIDPISSLEDYNRFVLKELDSFIATEYVLISQWDGYILDFSKWNDIFYRYDYIGAKWKWKDRSIKGGNGFFIKI